MLIQPIHTVIRKFPQRSFHGHREGQVGREEGGWSSPRAHQTLPDEASGQRAAAWIPSVLRPLWGIGSYALICWWGVQWQMNLPPRAQMTAEGR